MRSAAAVRVAGSVDAVVPTSGSISAILSYLYIPKSLVKEVARELSRVHRTWLAFYPGSRNERGPLSPRSLLFAAVVNGRPPGAPDHTGIRTRGQAWRDRARAQPATWCGWRRNTSAGRYSERRAH